MNWIEGRGKSVVCEVVLPGHVIVNVLKCTVASLVELNDGTDVHVSVTMPSIEVGTVGGGTQLAAQKASLNMMGVAGPNLEDPGENANQLAKNVAATVLAGEISLMSALASNHLVSAHMKLNRQSS